MCIYVFPCIQVEVVDAAALDAAADRAVEMLAMRPLNEMRSCWRTNIPSAPAPPWRHAHKATCLLSAG